MLVLYLPLIPVRTYGYLTEPQFSITALAPVAIRSAFPWPRLLSMPAGSRTLSIISYFIIIKESKTIPLTTQSMVSKRDILPVDTLTDLERFQRRGCLENLRIGTVCFEDGCLPRHRLLNTIRVLSTQIKVKSYLWPRRPWSPLRTALLVAKNVLFRWSWALIRRPVQTFSTSHSFTTVARFAALCPLKIISILYS